MAPFDPYTHVIKPMLAESRQTPFDSKDHIFELKWDGTRALAVVRDGLRFQNRRLSYVESRYPDLAVHTRKPAILDGEIVVMNGPLPSFEKLQQREQASGKIKMKTTLDCIICGITAGEGERTDTFGSLILGAYFEGALFHVGRVGTGFSEKLRRTLFQRLVTLRQEECPFPEAPEIDAHVGFWTKPEIVVEAHFLEFSKDRHMRAPSFSRVRDDKRPEECVVTFS